MNALGLTSMAAVSTTLGGSCAILLHRRMPLLMAFGAGVLVGVACLDLIPAALAVAVSHQWPGRMVFEYVALGAFLFFYIQREAELYATPGRDGRMGGRISAALLILHSTLDGAAIWAASTISIQVGLIVGLGIVAHDICDGLNTILLSTAGEKPEKKDYVFLGLDALAPMAGGLIARYLFSISPTFVMLFLSFAAGSFLFTATVGLFSQACRHGRRFSAPAITLAGFFFIWGLTKVIGSITL